MNKEERILKEKERLQEMMTYERALYEKGIKYIAGVDEVGRGPLAGPVVAAAVILPPDFSVLGVDDSKKISEKKREELFDQIKENALAFQIGIVDNQRIDEINILEATKEAMTMAITGLYTVGAGVPENPTNANPPIRPDHILIDALTLKNVDIAQTGIIKGDANSVSIAAASILAKVTRDRMMIAYHDTYPDYAFDKNKGYGTKAHYEAIEKAGITPIHRRSFLKNIL